MKASIQDRKGRYAFLVLAALMVLSVGLTGFALRERAAEWTSHHKSVPFVPGFAAQVKEVASINIVSNDGSLNLVYRPSKGWVMPGNGDYPANPDEVRHALIGISSLQIISPGTARADWLHFVNLGTPPKGNGLLMTVARANGTVLASIVFGKTEALSDSGGGIGVFVRRPSETQSYLTRTVFVPQSDASSWLVNRVADISGAQLKSVAMKPESGSSYIVSRNHPTDRFYTLGPIPKGRIPDQAKVNLIPYAITTLTFLHLRPVAQVDFDTAAHAVALTFDGLSVDLAVTKTGSEIWARVSASTTPGAALSVAHDAAAINARAKDWAFQLSNGKGGPLLAHIPDLLMAPGNPLFGIAGQAPSPRSNPAITR